MFYDIFNGDADGIFSLHQYRLENPVSHSRLITGVKRDIQLLAQVQDVSNCNLTVFDISLDSNRPALLRLLQQNNTVRYFDHHFAGDIPGSPALSPYIDLSAETCTSLIVHAQLSGKYTLWAICGAFGDNLHRKATTLAKTLKLSPPDIIRLQELGELFNYNGYGYSLEDLHFHPQQLYQAVQPFANPFDFLDTSTELVALRTGCREDIALAMQQQELKTSGKNRIYRLPDAPWARRVVGVFSNLRAKEEPASAHAVVTENSDGTLRISVRAPLAEQCHADRLCRLFPTGGGRAAAAGINNLPAEMFDRFIDTFQSFYTR
ncbi:MAG TPA: acetyltransferase [Desulfobulbaceae bacterium]|nr:acetyltransferase [Desulfobulbaceae bacterium]